MTDFSFTLTTESGTTTRPSLTSDLAYGTDISCGLELDANVAEVDPQSTQAIGEALVRRLDCPRGELIDDPDYGISLSQMLNRGATDRDILELAQKVRSECEKDDRVRSAIVTVTPSSEGSQLAVSIRVTPQSPSEVFTLTFFFSTASALTGAINGNA